MRISSATSRRCSPTLTSSAPRWWGAPWAPPPRWPSRSSIPSVCRRSCRSRPPTRASREPGTWTATAGSAWPPSWRAVAREATRQRMERHEHPQAVAQALRELPSSAAWSGLERLEDLDVPVLIVASRDEADRLHPFEVARRYESRLPRAELVVEEEGKSPLAWQGARLSGVIGDFLEREGYAP